MSFTHSSRSHLDIILWGAGKHLRSHHLIDSHFTGRPASRSKRHANVPVCDDSNYFFALPHDGQETTVPCHISSVAEPRLLSGRQ